MTAGAGTGPAAPPRTRTGRLDLAQIFFNGAGRIGRRTFVAAMLPVCLVARWAAGDAGVWSWALWFLALVTACTVLSKRLHDLSLAGWWSAAPVGLVAVAVNGEAPTTPAQATALLVAAGCVAVLAAWPGEPRFNRFGPTPHEGVSGRSA